MHNANIPDATELPSSAKLFKSTIIAIIAAAIILVTIVLPAEYGIDPTGFGKLTGLKRMGEIKAALAQEAESADLQAATPQTAEKQIEQTATARTDAMSVTLAPDKSTEIKITMAQNTVVEFAWSTDTGTAFYDLHGDSSSINYHVYQKGSSASEQGTLKAEFDGNHGWYWKNRTNETITITLTTTGEYQDIKEMK